MEADVATISPDEQQQEWTLARFLELDLPEGLKAELVDGEIVVVPPPTGTCATILGRIARQIGANCSALETLSGSGLITPRGRFIPDLVVAPEGWGFEEKSWFSPEELEMVVEVTSSRPEDDRNAKRRGYAEAGIPLYLLVDRDRNEVVLRSQPGDGDYHQAFRTAIGGEVPLPEPFGFALKTHVFLR
jgi:Uma2 family endonuclease